MNNLDIKTIVRKIKSLTNNDPFKYLEAQSTWFSESFVSLEHKDRYPYITGEFDSFFFDKSISKLEKEVGLKFVVNNELKQQGHDRKKSAKWIIKTWGGIRGIKDSSIQDIVENLDKQEFLYKNISSWSKVLSFKNIDNDVIYDSKAIYSLNWLLLHLNNPTKYFVQPEGRNRKLIAFPINAIINFRHSKLINLEKRGEKAIENVYYKSDEVYIKYREIVRLINLEIWDNKYIDLTKLVGHKVYLKDYSFFTELLLFNMADDVIVTDVQNNVSISYKYEEL